MITPQQHEILPYDKVSIVDRVTWCVRRGFVLPLGQPPPMDLMCGSFAVQFEPPVWRKDNFIAAADEGTTWCRGWEGEAVLALEAVVALMTPARVHTARAAMERQKQFFYDMTQAQADENQ